MVAGRSRRSGGSLSGGKSATYYSPEALAFQARFFDCFLKDEENGVRDLPLARLEVRESGPRVHEVRREASWPLLQTRWTPRYLHAGASHSVPLAARCGALDF